MVDVAEVVAMNHDDQWLVEQGFGPVASNGDQLCSDAIPVLFGIGTVVVWVLLWNMVIRPLFPA